MGLKSYIRVYKVMGKITQISLRYKVRASVTREEFKCINKELRGAKSFLRGEQSLSYSKIPKILWNPKVYYGTHKSPQMVSILSQLNPANINVSYFSKFHFNIIIAST
jgi:hypothetical protein